MRGLVPGSRVNALFGYAKDRHQPLWIRIISVIVFGAMQILYVAALLQKHHLFSTASGRIIIFCAVCINSCAGIAVIFFTAQFLRSESRLEGRSIAGLIGHMLLGTFLYIFVPCMLLTAILVTWALLTHQPTFR